MSARAALLTFGCISVETLGVDLHLRLRGFYKGNKLTLASKNPAQIPRWFVKMSRFPSQSLVDAPLATAFNAWRRVLPRQPFPVTPCCFRDVFIPFIQMDQLWDRAKTFEGVHFYGDALLKEIQDLLLSGCSFATDFVVRLFQILFDFFARACSGQHTVKRLFFPPSLRMVQAWSLPFHNT